jgi:PAS domain S-box-containing protein
MIVPELRLANEALNALAAHVVVLDARGVIVFGNEAWHRFATANGAAPGAEGYVGANYLDICRDAACRGDETAGLALSGIEAVLRHDRDTFAFDYRCDNPDQERWYRMSVTRFVSGADLHLVVAHEDITAQKQSERTLQDGERLLRSVLESLPVGVWVMDVQGQIVHGNSAGVRIWGGARFVGPQQFGEYKGWWLSTGEPIAAHEWAAARAVREGETSIDEEVEIESFDGTRKIILNSAVPLFDEERRITGAIIVNQDITARKRIEQEREAMLRDQARLRLEAIAANQAKDKFIAELSHELRMPLQSVLGWAAMLKRTLPDVQASERAVTAIERNAQIQAQLLNDTLDVSRIAHGKLRLDETDVDIAFLTGEVVEAMRPIAVEKRVALVSEAGPATKVRGDATRLRQILWNLLSNALKFTPSGGRISVRTVPAGAWVDLSVADTGVGIAPEFMPYLFDRFRQGSGPSAQTRLGLGLGLSIVKDLVTLHGGTVTAASPGEGQGATFTIRLPRART